MKIDHLKRCPTLDKRNTLKLKFIKVIMLFIITFHLASSNIFNNKYRVSTFVFILKSIMNHCCFLSFKL